MGLEMEIFTNCAITPAKLPNNLCVALHTIWANFERKTYLIHFNERPYLFLVEDKLIKFSFSNLRFVRGKKLERNPETKTKTKDNLLLIVFR